ncbi:ABC-type transport system involved in resistance to organic solvents, permease component USSDB6A [Hyphomicrobiales bacterium]|nr:ABC-type transport system involved in resistance to organic solvents, permease component USSDB6A [Hyphomicrobiales bacterium]CAH1700753.1 ABC-type transport system involved in resistance to organic solvents, permease component USSDB6A [Hyphomicrobiales bacterium]CAI0344626.1 phospholipid/cholesterol/gamma-HCH transport system permease protein [Hyphomicrobiales bacterium]
MASVDTAEPQASIRDDAGTLAVALAGSWSADRAPRIEQLVGEIAKRMPRAGHARLDLSNVTRLDTLGAYILNRLKQHRERDGAAVDIVSDRPEHAILLAEVRVHDEDRTPEQRHFRVVDILVDIGQSVVRFGRDMVGGAMFLGEVVVGSASVVLGPRKFRGPSLVNQIELIAFNGAPIIMLISFLVGCIVAQQGIFQLQQFGASVFVVNLTGILILRELAVLLTSIMIAGRSGSAFTAEIGSMKMREEIDALRVMGLDPIEVLVVPRILALIISLPILTFISAMAGLVGAGLVTWLYGGIGVDTFLARLQSVITWKHFAVGLIKAPFMAFVIGLIASIEGLAVQGSAESLGRQVTASVVKAIFMVIVVDGLFAMFFASIEF